MSRPGSHRGLQCVSLAALVMCGGCTASDFLISDPYQLMDDGPATSAIVIVDARLYVDEDPSAFSGTSLVGAFIDGLLGLEHDVDELRGDRLELEGGELRVLGSGQTVRGFANRGHLVFLDVPPGEVRLTEIRGYRPIDSWDRREWYDCESDAAPSFSCPSYWVYAFPTDSRRLAGLRVTVATGEVAYLGYLYAGGRYDRPPYREAGHAYIEDHSLFGFGYELEPADHETVEVVTAHMTHTASEERAAYSTVLDHMEREDWKEILAAGIARIDGDVVAGGAPR